MHKNNVPKEAHLIHIYTGICILSPLCWHRICIFSLPCNVIAQDYIWWPTAKFSVSI